MSRVPTVALILCGALTACQTITEEMPQAVSTALPTAAPTVAPHNSPTATPTDAPATATPVPTNAPTAAPTSTPSTDPYYCDNWPPHCAPVASVGIMVLYAVCPWGGQIAGSRGVTHLSSTCEIRIDCTAHGSDGTPTYSPHAPTWAYTGGYRMMDETRNNGYSPYIFGDSRPGIFTAQATIDGVASNLLTITWE
jgi:hypothetical protein